MGKRARTRAIRAEMTKTGENYTRAAAKVGNSPTWTAGSRTDAVREHVRRVLEGYSLDADARYRRVEELERNGRRIVTGGQTFDGWEIRDWRTNELIAQGNGGLNEYDAVVQQLDPDGMWFHEDHLYDLHEPAPSVTTPGVPASLAVAIEDSWIGVTATPHEEIAEFIGWPVEKVRKARQD